MAWLIRREFAKNGARMAASLRAAAPSGVSAVKDERYDSDVDARLNVYTPGAAAPAGRSLPTVVWTHGGAFVGGSKDELDGYLRMIAHAGFTVAGVEYTLAPAATYPKPVSQVMEALRHLQTNSDRLHVDPSRIIVAGDSAGAHITAQVAAIATDPGYARQVGVASAIGADQLAGVVLCCGIYDLDRLSPSSPLKNFVLAVGWSYSGSRDYRNDHRFTSSTAIPRHITAAFPPTFITVGNADPLAPQSLALAAALESKGVAVDTLFFPEEHKPALGHEYQFDLSFDDARTALDRLIAFLQRRSEAGATPP
jgi:acetyl esterase/lipase